MRGSLAVWIVGAFALAVAAIAVGSLVSGPTIRNAASWFAVYFVIWWLILFAVLPMGVRSQHESGEVLPGTDPGAPIQPALGRKAIWTSLLSLVLLAALYMLAPYMLP